MRNIIPKVSLSLRKPDDSDLEVTMVHQDQKAVCRESSESVHKIQILVLKLIRREGDSK